MLYGSNAERLWLSELAKDDLSAILYVTMQHQENPVLTVANDIVCAG